MIDEIYTALPALSCSKRKVGIFAAIILSLAGLITQGLENVKSYLHRRRNEAVAKAGRAHNGE